MGRTRARHSKIWAEHGVAAAKETLRRAPRFTIDMLLIPVPNVVGVMSWMVEMCSIKMWKLVLKARHLGHLGEDIL